MEDSIESVCRELRDTWGEAFAEDESINGGDFVEWMAEWWPRYSAALAAQESELERIKECARAVIDNWSGGDLAGAVNELQKAID